MTTKFIVRACLAALCFVLTGAAHAEGSRSLFPSGASGNRANLEWRTNTYGNLLLRHTLLYAYAQAGEYIEVGSRAEGVGSGNILIFNPNRVSGSVGNEFVPATPDFQATSQAGKGVITTRAQELAGPKSADGTANTTGYAPAYYVAPSTGLYAVVFYGPDGANSAADGTIGADVALTNANDFNTNQHSSVAAWDVTVRGSASSASDLNGRVFSNYLALFTCGNGLPMYSRVYAVTSDGFQYRIDLNGLDPNGFIVYGNQIGFLDSDGTTPLYHDVVGNNGQISNIQGGCTLSLPSFPIFFNTPDNSALIADNVSTSPILPSISGLTFTGNGGSGGPNSLLGQGGTFQFNSNIGAVYEIVISREK